MTTFASNLLINDLELSVHLGWPDSERDEKQIVHTDIDIHFTHAPKACESDHLTDTLCYATLIDVIREKIAHQHFHLIEHLSYTIYHIIEPLLPAQSHITVRIKKHPKIEGLAGYVSFSYSG